MSNIKDLLQLLKDGDNDAGMIDKEKYIQEVFFGYIGTSSMVINIALLETMSDGKFKSGEFIDLIMQIFKATVSLKIKKEMDRMNEDKENISDDITAILKKEQEDWNTEIQKYHDIWSNSMKESVEPFKNIVKNLTEKKDIQKILNVN